jgi:antitoxin component YwqK of YwqJK toxin-antitoxin module
MRYILIIIISLNFLNVTGQEAYDNFTDSKGQKQGRWIYSKKETCNNKINKCIYQEGNYSNNQKIGVWKYYKCVGGPCDMRQELQYEIHHINDFVFDTLRKYDNSEKLKLKYIKRRYQSGAAGTRNADFTIDSYGEVKVSTLNGIIKTYYDDGTLKSEFNFSNNQPAGNFKCYYDNGVVRYEGEVNTDSDYARIKEYYSTGAFKIEKNLLLDMLLRQWTCYYELR